jgi:hypothetical protein
MIEKGWDREIIAHSGGAAAINPSGGVTLCAGKFGSLLEVHCRSCTA